MDIEKYKTLILQGHKSEGLAQLLINKGIITQEEYNKVIKEAEEYYKKL